MAQLDPEIQKFIDNQAPSPPINKLPILQARNFLESIQSQVVYDIPLKFKIPPLREYRFG